MSILGAGELARMRAEAALLFDQTVTIQRVTRAPDGRGGQTETWATYATVPASLSRTAGLERRLGERVVAQGDWLIRVPQGTGATARDRVIAGNRMFEVRTVISGRSRETIEQIVAQETV